MDQKVQKKNILCHPHAVKAGHIVSKGVVIGGLTAMAFSLGFAWFGVMAAVTPGTVNLQKKTDLIANSAIGTPQVKSLGTVAGMIIQVVLGVLGIVFVILITYAGFRWMTAQGDTKDIDAARSVLFNSIIGLIIVVAANALTYWILKKLAESV